MVLIIVSDTYAEFERFVIRNFPFKVRGTFKDFICVSKEIDVLKCASLERNTLIYYLSGNRELLDALKSPNPVGRYCIEVTFKDEEK